MRADLRDVLRTGARKETQRVLGLSVLFAVLVAVAAGIVGTTHFTGARWVPHWSTADRVAPPKVRSSQGPPTKPMRVTSGHVGSLPLEAVAWTLVGLIVVGVAILAWRWWTRRRGPAALDRHGAAVEVAREVSAGSDPEPDKLLTGIELALQVLDQHREPADAIVRAWLGLEETAEESGLVRQPAETPTEFTSRILSSAFADDRAIRTLLRLYLRTRFGDHPVTSDDVASVRMALEELVRTWRTADAASPMRAP